MFLIVSSLQKHRFGLQLTLLGSHSLMDIICWMSVVAVSFQRNHELSIAPQSTIPHGPYNRLTCSEMLIYITCLAPQASELPPFLGIFVGEFNFHIVLSSVKTNGWASTATGLTPFCLFSKPCPYQHHPHEPATDSSMLTTPGAPHPSVMTSSMSWSSF